MGEQQVGVRGEHVGEDFTFVEFGVGRRPGDGQAAGCAEQVQAQAPEEAPASPLDFEEYLFQVLAFGFRSEVFEILQEKPSQDSDALRARSLYE
ncbi:hypothetical protein [Streptomyces sp. NPDC059080]|uniref:hypothetical protein n=1 Tax=Streptomyces sp. NPDC059080 TaxID=3346718 RepID=UPI0036C14F79